MEKASKPLNAPLTAPVSALKAQRKEPVTVQQMLGPQNDLVHHVLAEPHPVFGTLVEGGNSHREVGIQFEGDEEIPNHDWRIHDKTFQVSGGRPIIAEVSLSVLCVSNITSNHLTLSKTDLNVAKNVYLGS